MPSQTIGFDIPQKLPPGIRMVLREEGYDSLQIMAWRYRPGRAPGASLDNWILSSVCDHSQPKKDFIEQLRTLHQHYTILSDDSTVREFLDTEPAVYLLLIEAVKPLQHAFGARQIIHVRVQSSDEDSILKVAVQLPADFGGDPEHALRSFDKTWWLNNCHRSGGALVFDYEMQDAIRLA